MSAKKSQKGQKSDIVGGLKWSQDRADECYDKGKFLHVSSDKESLGQRSGSWSAMSNFLSDPVKNSDGDVIYLTKYNVTGKIQDVVDALAATITDESFNQAYNSKNLSNTELIDILVGMSGAQVVNKDNVDGAENVGREYESKWQEYSAAMEHDPDWTLMDLVRWAQHISTAKIKSAEVVAENKSSTPKKKSGRRTSLYTRFHNLPDGKLLRLSNFAKTHGAITNPAPLAPRSQLYAIAGGKLAVKSPADLTAAIEQFIEDAPASEKELAREQSSTWMDDLKQAMKDRQTNSASKSKPSKPKPSKPVGGIKKKETQKFDQNVEEAEKELDRAEEKVKRATSPQRLVAQKKKVVASKKVQKKK